MSEANDSNLDEVDASLGKEGKNFLTLGQSNILTHPSEDASTQRRGPKGYFQGSRKKFLESNIPGYTACKKGNRQNFWHVLFSSWWKLYPWKLNDSHEPPTDPEAMVDLESVESSEISHKEIVEGVLMGVQSVYHLH
jgi:hypothetical protein